jgi:hypothetical protein
VRPGEQDRWMTEERPEPLWEPVVTATPTAWERIHISVRQYGFPLAVLLAVPALVATLLMLPQAAIPAFDESSFDAPFGEDTRVLPFPTGITGMAAPHRAVSVTSRPRGATVIVDFDSVGVTPIYGLVVPEGAYLLSLSSHGYATMDTVVLVSAGSSMFDFQLRSLNPRPAPLPRAQEPVQHPQRLAARPQAPPRGMSEANAGQVAQIASSTRSGSIAVESEPSGAGIWLDGLPVGETPATLHGVKPGPHLLVLRKRGFVETEVHVDVEADAVQRVEGQLRMRTW